ncbi:gluconokinase [Roseateles saccharophilus]|uniref:Gluconokinase n=1 Tax=Roseateles saccharophilus TaxID=304 RepID=A0A4R3V272_ROSSA|nr:gluconokinase [Roseateles saccharophilus]TCU97333.1 gluconokinase [Roseateles saccharophilus]
MLPDHPSVGTPPLRLVVMGVAGCGKSTLAQALGTALRLPVIEGDDFHPPRNRELMRRGIALTDADRAGWLAALGAELARHAGGAVLSCSALKRAYRDRLREAAPGLRFAYLALDEATALARVRSRAGNHYFNPGLVRSQFETLAAPDGEPGVLSLDALQPVEALCDTALGWLTRTPPSHSNDGDKP